MLARPLASETVMERAVCRLKCSVVANVTVAPRREPSCSANAAVASRTRSSEARAGAPLAMSAISWLGDGADTAHRMRRIPSNRARVAHGDNPGIAPGVQQERLSPTQKVKSSSRLIVRSPTGLFADAFVGVRIFRRRVPLGTPTAEGLAN